MEVVEKKEGRGWSDEFKGLSLRVWSEVVVDSCFGGKGGWLSQ